MKLDASIEPTIGPYEVYEDGWFSAKAAFEAYVTVRDDAETAKLTKLAGALQDIENNLPIDAKLRNPKLGGMAPIRVVNVDLLRRRRQQVGAGRRVQPPQRRTHRQGGRHQAHAAQERAGGEVQARAAAHQPHRARARPTASTSRSTRSSRTS